MGFIYAYLSPSQNAPRRIETCKGVYMVRYKRNQVELAISRVVGSSASRPPMALRHRLKRLLDTDRALGRNSGLAYAFYAGDAPGSGVEVWFSAYEAFALLVAFNLLEHDFAQQKAVLALRRIRHALEREHKRMLKLDPEVLFHQDALQRSPGQLVVSSTHPVFLVIKTEEKRAAKPLKDIRICHGDFELMRFIKAALASYTIFELTSPAHLLDYYLAKTEPSHRGRAAT
jgi:hypothetical protein